MENDIQFEQVIGLEVHIQLNTLSKAFCGDSAAYGGDPNTHVSQISLAHPGTLPRPNTMHVEQAVRLGLALGCRINEETYFDRKHYFYADLPKGFQTTQDGAPICLGGHFAIKTEMGEKVIRIHHIHMEEDAGKSIHDPTSDGSLLDFNRAGVPLLEMVTEPDFRSSDEVYLFINQLRQLVRYLEVSDGNMEEGSIRCDCNISVRPMGFEGLNPRCEVKNVNSARYARKAIDFEVDRQIKRMQNGQKVEQQTREFLPIKGITRLLRGKEDAHDYRYLPEPDIAPIRLSERKIQQIKSEMPLLPADYTHLLENTYGLSTYDSDIITEQKDRVVYFLELLSSTKGIEPSSASKLFINKIIPHLDEHHISPGEFHLSSDEIKAFLLVIQTGDVASSIAYQKLWPVLLENPQDSRNLIAKLNLKQTNDEDLIVKIAREVIDENPDQVEKYLRGKKAVSKFFVGQVMKKSRGKANPAMANQVIEGMLIELRNTRV